MNVTLGTVADLKQYARRIYMQTVQNKAIPARLPVQCDRG
jgi:uncharacterized membrane protein